MKIITKISLPLLFIALFNSCSDNTSPDSDHINFDKSLGFFPLQIGNYWETDKGNYSKITDTVRLEGELFYKEVSLIGGDAFATRILKVDENNNLIRGFENYPSDRWILAKFNLEVGDTFSTIGDGSINDFTVTVINKTDDEISFKYESFTGIGIKKYIKGFGLDRGDTYAIINGKEYHINNIMILK